MKIIPITEKNFPLAERFIKPYEESCIFLSSYIRRREQNLYFLSESPTSSSTLEIKNILGVLYINHTIFHCIPYHQKINKDEFFRALIIFTTQNEISVKCISGKAEVTQMLCEFFSSKIGEPYQTNHYNLMIAKNVNSPTEKLFNGDEIKRCSENDFEDLLEIQTEYMKSEVSTYGHKISEAEVSLNLRQMLRNQLCLALISDEKIVAKANTNAIGINWIQLGGIYTHPLYRRNGYAWQLISALCRKIFNDGKKVALFVKDINVPAMELYKKLGFTTVGTYEICYF